VLTKAICKRRECEQTHLGKKSMYYTWFSLMNTPFSQEEYRFFVNKISTFLLISLIFAINFHDTLPHILFVIYSTTILMKGETTMRRNPYVKWQCPECDKTNTGTCSDGDYWCGCGYSYVHYAGNPDKPPKIIET